MTHQRKSTSAAAAGKTAMAVMISILFFAASAALGAASSPVAPAWPHEKCDLEPDPALTFGTLPNGLRYVLMENPKPEGRISMHLNVQAGSFHETEDQRGLAHFLEHMLFNGSKHFKPGELVKYFQRIGMQFGPDANARTGFFDTVYDVLLPDNSRESIEEGLLVLWDYAAGALLLPEEIDQERKVLLAEKRSRDSVSYRTFVETLKFELSDIRLANRMPIGKAAVLETAGRPRMKAYYDTWYRPEMIVLVMVGDFESDQVLPLIKDRFSDMTARAPAKPSPAPDRFDHEGVKPFHHHEPEAGNTRTDIEVVVPVGFRPDSFAFQKQQLLWDLSHRIVQNRLDALLKQPDTPFTSASTGAGIYLNAVAYAAISAEGPPESWEASLAAIEQVLRKALEHGFTEAETDRVKKDYLAALENAVKSADTRDSTHLARRIIRHINNDRVFQSPLQERNLYGPVIRNATPADLHQALREAWKPDHRLVLVTGNADIQGEEGTEPDARIRSVYDKSRETPVSPPAETEAVSFPYLDPPEKMGEIVSENRIEDLSIIQVDFDNGLRLNLKPTDFEANTVVARLSFGPGQSAQPMEKPGLAHLTEAVVNESGLGTLDKDQLERALAGKETSVGFGVSEDRFYFRGRAVTDELDLLFQLLHAHLVDPGFREQAYVLSMERFRQRHKALSRTVDGAILLEGKRFLAGGDVRFGLPPISDFEALTLSDVRKWLGHYLRNSRMELSIVGEMETDRAIKLARTYLGGLSLGPASAPPDNPVEGLPDFPEGGSLNTTVETEIPKGLVIVAYPTDDIWDIHRTRRLSALASVFDDRLRETIREELGATYSPVAYNDPSRAYDGYGLFQTLIHLAPEEAGPVIGAVKEISTEIRETGVTEDEVRRAVDPTLTSIKDMRRENRYWLSTVLDGSRDHPEQIQWSRNIVKDYASITPEAVHEMARRYLDNARAATVIITPEKGSGDPGKATGAAAEKGGTD
jgi:zinc protease